MEYIFGMIDRGGELCENLKTVGAEHSALSGFEQTVREYPDATITDTFRIVEHYRSDKDGEGNCYDWYIIADHWRNVDHFSPVKKETEEANATAAITFVTLAESGQLDDTTITEHASAFPRWTPQWTGRAGTILEDEGCLYRSIHDVGAGQNTKPSETPSMWTKIGDPAEEYPEWSQPIGEHDAYAFAAKVTHHEKKWVSDYENNVWEPGVFGWTEVTGDE